MTPPIFFPPDITIFALYSCTVHIVSYGVRPAHRTFAARPTARARTSRARKINRSPVRRVPPHPISSPLLSATASGDSLIFILKCIILITNNPPHARSNPICAKRVIKSIDRPLCFAAVAFASVALSLAPIHPLPHYMAQFSCHAMVHPSDRIGSDRTKNQSLLLLRPDLQRRRASLLPFPSSQILAESQTVLTNCLRYSNVRTAFSTHLCTRAVHVYVNLQYSTNKTRNSK